MSKVLKNLQLTFGETAASPKVLPIASVNTLIKAIEDPEVNTRFSGHITSESGSLNAAQAYSLALAGLTFHGTVTPIDFTLNANKTEVVDGSEILFNTSGVPTSAIDFSINNITINSGSLNKSDVESICSIENNKLIIAPAGVTYDWQATIEIKAVTKYTPSTEHTINIIIKHKAYNSIVINQSNVNFNTATTINVPLSFTPVDANVSIESVRATLENVSAIYEVGVLGNSISITCNSVEDLVNNKINIEATDIAGKILRTNINISNKVDTTPNIVSADNFIAKNGKGSLECTFGFTPEKYNVNVEFVSVSSSNSLVNINNASINGFTLNTTDVVTDTNTTITAKIKVDSVIKTITKTINIIYQHVFNEFKVYINSAWVVPSTNVEVKVGNNVASYIGNGLWAVDESIIDDTLDVIANNIILGKYGLDNYSDGSDIVESTYDYPNAPFIGNIDIVLTKDVAINEGIKSVIGCNYSNNATDTLKFVHEWDNDSNKAFSRYNSYTLILPQKVFINEKDYIVKFSTSGSLTQITSKVSFIVEKKQIASFTPDLSLPSTSFIAKNGTLNELIVPTTPNTPNADVVLTNISSSNSAITAAIENSQIKLTGTIADSNPQTSTLTIDYTVNGYNRSVEVEIMATYQEVEEEYEAIDLGLPSGIRWANRNVGAKKPEDIGLYFMWGETEGHERNNGFNFSNANYSAKGLDTISANLTLAQDAANVNLGGSWRMPTNKEFEELYKNTNVTWTTINGIDGRKFVNKTDASKYIFMPAAGSSLGSWNSRGYFWSSTFSDSSNAYGFSFNSNDQYTSSYGRYYGFSVRGVL